MHRPRIAAYLLVALLLVASVAPAAAAGALGTDAGAAQVESNGNVTVTVGQQLSTLMVETDSDVRSEVDETRFEVRFERSTESERARAIAERAAELAERAIELNEAYREATRAHEAGELDDSEYAERLATLNARGEDLAESVRQLRGRAAGLSALELRTAGYTAADLRAVDERLDAVTGSGAAALRERFTGRSAGEVRIETHDGLSIEVEGEDGEWSREVERSRDDDHSFTVSQADALETARAALGPPPAGNWSLERASVHDEDGYYRFRFALTGASATGSAEVRVDGSSGEVFRLETEIEAREPDDDRDGEGERDHRELALVVVRGTPGPGQTVTLQALAEGEAVPGASVSLNDRPVGPTDENGTVTVTLPDDEAEFEVESGDAEGELEFEFDDRDRERDALRRHFQATAEADGSNVTVILRYDGDPIPGATVLVDDREVGTTDADGVVSFQAADHDELDLTVRRGAFVADLAFETRQGTLTLVEVDVEDADEDRDERENDDDRDEDDVEEDEVDEDDDHEADEDDDHEEEDRDESDDDEHERDGDDTDVSDDDDVERDTDDGR